MAARGRPFRSCRLSPPAAPDTLGLRVGRGPLPGAVMLDAIVLQILNGLDKGSAYALIALGLTLVFGTLGLVNFAHGALFMLGAFCAVAFQNLLTLSTKVKDP